MLLIYSLTGARAAGAGTTLPGGIGPHHHPRLCDAGAGDGGQTVRPRPAGSFQQHLERPNSLKKY